MPLSTAEAKQTYRTEHRGGSVLLNPESWGFATIAGNGLPDSPVTPDLGPQEENRLNEVVCARWPSTDPGLALHQLSGNIPDSQAKTAPCQPWGSREPTQPPSDPVLGAAAVPSTSISEQRTPGSQELVQAPSLGLRPGPLPPIHGIL